MKLLWYVVALSLSLFKFIISMENDQRQILSFIFLFLFFLFLSCVFFLCLKGGMVLETNINAILQGVKDQRKLHDDSLNAPKPSESASQVQSRLGGNSSTNQWQYNF